MGDIFLLNLYVRIRLISIIIIIINYLARHVSLKMYIKIDMARQKALS